MKHWIDWIDNWFHAIMERRLEQMEEERLDYIEEVGFGD
jgi:hypothetical protein